MTEIALFMSAVPLAAAWLKLDSMTGWRLSNVPRTAADVTSHPQFLFACINGCDSSRQVTDLKFVVTGTLSAEPKKGATVAKGFLQWEGAHGEQRSPPLFVKTPSGRDISIFLKSLAVVFQRQQREVAFYNLFVPWLRSQLGCKTIGGANVDDGLEPSLGLLNVPRCFYAHWSRLSDRTILVFRDVGDTWKPIPDHRGVPPSAIYGMLRQIVVVHAATLHSTQGVRPSVLAVMPEKQGLDWVAGLMKLYVGEMSSVQREVWCALQKVMVHMPLCASHGDCRPGNMLFSGEGPKIQVVMTDWEAFSVTPFLWDCAYAMLCGLEPTVRRESEREIVTTYLKWLTSALEDSPGNHPELPDDDEALQLCRRLYLVVYFFGWLLQKVGGVGDKQGNSSEDVKAWRERVLDAVCHVFSEDHALVQVIGKGTTESFLQEVTASLA